VRTGCDVTQVPHSGGQCSDIASMPASPSTTQLRSAAAVTMKHQSTYICELSVCDDQAPSLVGSATRHRLWTSSVQAMRDQD